MVTSMVRWTPDHFLRFMIHVISMVHVSCLVYIHDKKYVTSISSFSRFFLGLFKDSTCSLC